MGSKLDEELKEEDFLFEKHYDCPLCGKQFVNPTVKAKKARLLHIDPVLRPIYKDIDPTKYDIIECRHCGYAAMNLYFGPLAKPHRDLLRAEGIGEKRPTLSTELVYGYEEAERRFRLAIACAQIRRARKSEFAMLSLHLGWVYRAHQDEMRINWEENPDKAQNLLEQEEFFLRNALENFLAARMEEQPPIAGMSNFTLDFLIASLCVWAKRYNEAARLLQGILMDRNADKSQKDRARQLMEKIREAGNNS